MKNFKLLSLLSLVCVATKVSSQDFNANQKIKSEHYKISTNDKKQPLYFINGVEFPNGAQILEDLKPSDIKSMTVYNGQDATTKYGANAIHGVIAVEINDLFENKVKTNLDKSEQVKNDGNIKKQPLYVVNGIKISKNSNPENNVQFLNEINPNDIQSVKVLKDQEAFAKYGEDGINGVILITTKNISKRELRKRAARATYHPKKAFFVSGLIVDCENVSVKSAKIESLSASNISEISDFDGKFKISASVGNRIKISADGFVSQIKTIENRNDLQIQLKASIKIGSQIMVKKPVIYLYPSEKTDVTIAINFKGKLLTTFPKLNEKWNLTAYPDGKIFDKSTKRFYNSLFWDGCLTFSRENKIFKNGFVVSKENLTDFLIEKLESFGLNTSETNDFIQYWLPLLEQNETNCIRFLVNSDYDAISTNIISPKPDTNIRVFMEFYNVEKNAVLPAQTFGKVERKGFVLVEWGGADVSKNVNNAIN